MLFAVETAAGPFEMELQFTQTYRRWRDAHPAIREAHSLRAMFPWVLRPIQETDLFAGRSELGPIGFALEPALGDTGYYCKADEVRQAMATADPGDERRRQVEEMLAFWASENTRAKHDAALPDDLRRDTKNAIAGGGPRLAGALPNYDRLLQLGLPGLRAEVTRNRAGAAQRGGDPVLFDGLELSLDLMADVCHYFARQAREQAQSASAPRREELATMADVLERLTAAAPASFREAIQLFWIYCTVSLIVNYGRMDEFLGDFYARDVDAGALTEPQALRLLQSLWQLIADRGITFNSRAVVGGMGRRNTPSADRFALLAMEATRTVLETEPQLTLRFHAGQDPSLMAKALEVIGEGRTYPMLYNDDVNVPAVQACFGVPREDAERYYPYGCGEYVLDHTSVGSPNCAFHLLKALEVVLHGGRDAMTGKPLGLPCGDLATYATFEDLFAAYARQVEHYALALARRHAVEYQVLNATAPFLLASLLYDGCLERGRGLMDGGARYRGAIFESFGMVNAADSLAAIRTMVYERGLIPPERLLAALEADFVGYEREHQLLLAAPKYGNDDDAADGMLQRVSDQAARALLVTAPQVGLDYCAIVNINNYANVTLGQIAAASPDGRRRGEPLANGSTPTAGRDRNGVTAMLNSLSKIDPSVHAGYTQNMKFSKRMFREDRPKLEALLRGYWSRGGAQAMITAVSRGDLENAMREPEKYANLVVRVGGFSARFVTLAREVQQDVLNRTLY